MRPLQASIRSSIVVAMIAGHAHAEDREALLSGAWDSFNRQDYTSATRLALPCADQTVRQAQREQARIETSEAPKPLPPGPVPDRNSQDVKRTFANGVLNDAGACLFIIGASQERASLCADARKTYQMLAKLTYSRVWDPKGWFWAPAEAAEDGLDRLKGHC